MSAVSRPSSTTRHHHQILTLKDSPISPSLRQASSFHQRLRLLIVKFGGSSLSNPKRISLAVASVAKEYARGNRVVVVVSAVGNPSDRDWPIITDDNFQNANPLKNICVQRIRRYLKPVLGDGVVPVIGGFIGRTRDGRISTLGRGGSDTTALLLAMALEADEVVLVTNVSRRAVV